MGMFDTAKVLSTPLTQEAGYADAEGTIFGVTTVSVTKVEMIGVPEDDTALCVDFDGRLPSAWFQPSLIEVTGSPDVELSIGPGRAKRVDGAWVEVRRPWWRFW